MSDKASSSKAISTPLLDLLCGGGLSIVALIAFDLAYDQGIRDWIGERTVESIPLILGLAILLNFPHFIASYFVLYSDPEHVREHRWASQFIPLILLAVCIAGYFLGSEENGKYQYNFAVYLILFGVSSVYLAWHYTGQSWGLTVAFAHLAGIKMTKQERTWIRLGYRMMLAYHVSVFFAATPQVMQEMGVAVPQATANLFRDCHDVMLVLMLLSIPFGLAAFSGMKKRTGVSTPWRSIMPWIATYVWYIFIYRHYEAFVLVQLAHATQYLIFPMRVCANRYAERTNATLSRRAIQLAGVYGLLVAIGYVVFMAPEWLDQHGQTATMVVFAVNIHHYFTDGVIWKMRNPKVQKTLFWHLS